MISGSNQQLQQQLEFTILKPDCHSWWISKMQSGHEDTLRERYAIKFCLNLQEMTQKRMECFSLLSDHLAWIEHQFLSVIRDSRKAGSLWGMMRGVRGVRKSIYQSWLAEGLGLGSICWGFKEVQEVIPSEETSTLQIGSVTFPAGQCTSPQLHPCHRLFDQDGHQDSSSASLFVQTLLPVTFGYSLSSEAVVMRQLRRWKRLWRRSLTRSPKRSPWGLPEVVGMVEQVHCSRERLLRRRLEFHVCTINKCGNLFKDPRIYIYIYIYERCSSILYKRSDILLWSKQISNAYLLNSINCFYV